MCCLEDYFSSYSFSTKITSKSYNFTIFSSRPRLYIINIHSSVSKMSSRTTLFITNYVNTLL